jgi:hypothetical protein
MQMQSRTFLLLCGLLAACAAASHGQDTPVIKGYVTRARSKSDFDVNSVRVLCSGKTRDVSKSVRDAEATVDCPGAPPYVGESLIIHYTERDTSINAVYAIRIERQKPLPFGETSGSAVIEAAPAEEETGAQPLDLTVRADGYRVRITAKTRIEWNPPFQSLGDVKAGSWIRYKGKLNAAGVLVAASAQIGPNIIGSGEESLRKKGEYDPSAVSAKAKQNFLKDGLAGGCWGWHAMGCDPKKFPPFEDAAMQARIEKIGKSLVPLYQRALRDSDPARIDFRFQLIDTKLFRDAITLPNGILLIPHQVVERLQNDSQLAAVLAEGIAGALERQQYRTGGKIKTAYASALAAPFVPYAGLGMSFGGSVARDIEMKAMEQRDRVGLALMHEAGYDINQAPMTWWLLDPEKPRPLSDIEMPERAAYLYRILGEVWSNSAASAPRGH